MKDSWILVLTALFMISLMLGGQFLRGDFTVEANAHVSVNTAGDLAAVEQDGRALININRADEETLSLLDGLGESLSRRIVEYREENGPFASVEELTNVKGIGKMTLERIRPRIVCLP